MFIHGSSIYSLQITQVYYQRSDFVVRSLTIAFIAEICFTISVLTGKAKLQLCCRMHLPIDWTHNDKFMLICSVVLTRTVTKMHFSFMDFQN